MYAFFVGDRGDAKITITILYRYETLLTENAIPPEPYPLRLSAVYLRRKLTFTAIALVPLTNQFKVLVNPENASETNATSNSPLLEKCTSCRATDVVSTLKR